MENTNIVTIQILDYCTDNPGVKHPGYSTIFGEKAEEVEFEFFCGIGTVIDDKNKKNGKYAIACGFFNGRFESCVKAYKNSVIFTDRYSEDYAVAGYYAYYFNAIDRQDLFPGQRIVLPSIHKDEKLIGKLLSANGYRHISDRSLTEGFYSNDMCLTFDNITDLGIGFSDKEYQISDAYYPKSYIHHTMTDNIRLACDFIDRYGRFDNCRIFALHTSDKEDDGIKKRKAIDDRLVKEMVKIYDKKICPGVIEVMYGGERWDDIEWQKQIANAFSDIFNNCFQISRGKEINVLKCTLIDGSLFCFAGVSKPDSKIRIMCHFDGKTIIGEYQGIYKWENGSDQNGILVKED